MATISFQIADHLEAELRELAAREKYPSLSAYLRHALILHMRHNPAAILEMEQRLLAEIRQSRKFPIAVYSAIDALVRMLFFLLPSKTGETHQDRYKKFVATVSGNFNRRILPAWAPSQDTSDATSEPQP
ncbi:MAG: hypothetical protein NVS1B6_04420 [Steroidobacteraceae bacterium]